MYRAHNVNPAHIEKQYRLDSTNPNSYSNWLQLGRQVHKLFPARFEINNNNRWCWLFSNNSFNRKTKEEVPLDIFFKVRNYFLKKGELKEQLKFEGLLVEGRVKRCLGWKSLVEYYVNNPHKLRCSPPRPGLSRGDHFDPRIIRAPPRTFIVSISIHVSFLLVYGENIRLDKFYPLMNRFILIKIYWFFTYWIM